MSSRIIKKDGDQPIPSAKGFSFAIVTAQWNPAVTGLLSRGCKEALMRCGAPANRMYEIKVPGSFELPLGARYLLDNTKADAVICLGCVIRGETLHFEYISGAVANGIMHLNLTYGRPVIFGVLTVNTMKQARERAGGRYGNKGEEAALAAIQMVALRR